MLCEHEEYRRKAFKIGLPDLMLHQLQHGKTVMAMEGAAQAICLLCLLNDRSVIRVSDWVAQGVRQRVGYPSQTTIHKVRTPILQHSKPQDLLLS